MKPPPVLAGVPAWAVNLDRRTDRWERLTGHMARLGLTAPNRWPAVDGRATSTPAEVARFHRGQPASEAVRAVDLGTAKSFRGLLTHLDDLQLPWALVLEDDALFLGQVHDQYTEFAALVPDDALVLLLGCIHKRRPKPLPGTSRKVWRATHVTCSHAFMVSAEAAPLLRQAAEPLTMSFDVAWNLVHQLGRSYAPSPHLAIQRPGDVSDYSGRAATRSRHQYGPET